MIVLFPDVFAHVRCKEKVVYVNRQEALKILGLDDDATEEDVKVAYKETVQILHPDKFAGNKKLQERATEQFKNLQEAYEYLTSGKGAKSSGSGSSSRARSSYKEQELEARLAGIAAARTQLVAQRDTLYDSRRNALMMILVGGLAALIARWRIPLIGGLGTAAFIWGIVDMGSIMRNISTVEEHLKKLTAERKKIESQLEDLE